MARTAVGGALVVLAVLFLSGPASADPNPPTVTITSPAGGSLLRGTVTVTAAATAGTNPVGHVDFEYYDSATQTSTPIGTDSKAPYSVQFDTTSVPNCEAATCTIYAQAFDTSSNASAKYGVGVGIANPIVVDTTTDTTDPAACSLREAVLSADGDTAVGACKNGLSGTTDTIEVPPGQYDLSPNYGELRISSDMDILGAGARETDIRGYALGTRVLEIDKGIVAIGGVTIEGGNETFGDGNTNAGVGGGIWIDQPGSLVLTDSTVSGNHADQSGGGIDVNGALTVERSTIENNSTGCGAGCGLGVGGGIDDFSSNAVIENSTIMGNSSSSDGGGLYVAYEATLTNDTIADNQADTGGQPGAGGGGITANGGSSVDLTNTLLAGNTWNGDAGDCSAGVSSLGYNLDQSGDCGFDNTGDQNGVDPLLGPVDSSGPTDVLPLTGDSPAIDAANGMACPTVDQRYVARPQGAGCDIGAYEATDGPTDYYVETPDELASAITAAGNFDVPATIHLAAGHYDVGNLRVGIGLGLGTITLEGAGARSTVLDGNGVSSDVVDVGGSPTTTIDGVSIQSGVSDGIYDNGLLVLDDSVVRDNGIYGVESVNDGLTVAGSTIAWNGNPGNPSGSAGGLYVESTFSAVDTTIAGNYGNGISLDYPGDGASLNNATVADNSLNGIDLGGTLSVSNTIVADNGGNESVDCVDAQSDLVSGGNNLDGDGSCFSFQSVPGDLTNTNPQLGPLQDNGGPTPTMALASSSPAIDAGNDATCALADQRGVARPQGAHCDIGAFELGSTVVTNVDDSGPGSLRAAIQYVNASGGGTISFDIPSGDAIPSISLQSPLDPITVPVIIDGASQPGTAEDSPGVTLVPGEAFTSGDVIDLAPGSGGSTVSGLAFAGNTHPEGGTTAIEVESNGNTISGNWIGVAADSSDVGPSYYGIEVTGDGNTIGGGTPLAENVITSSAQDAISLTSSYGPVPTANVIQGNLIGLEPDGTPTSGQGNGISIRGATNTVIGSDVGPSDLGNVDPQLGNVISGTGDAIDVIHSTGTIAAGNFIGVDRSGAATSPNARGIVVGGSSGSQIGPGNAIAHTTNDGVAIFGGEFGPATGNRIVANSIFDSGSGPGGGLGIDLQEANDGIAAPTITSVAGSTVSGTYTGSDPMFIEIFVNGSCTGPYANGAGEIYSTFVSASVGQWSADVPGLKPTDGITATATDQITNDTSEFSNCETSVAGSLTGSLTVKGFKPVDLTGAGTSDWAVWGQGLAGDQPNALPPTDYKATGGRQIGNLSIDNPNGVAPRGFGTDSTAPFTFSWSDGTPLASASGALAGLTAPSLGTGLSFTVPADTTPRTLTIWTSAHYADGTLTAHLSDGSAPDYTQVFHAVQGEATGTGENVPGVFTIHYQAASAGQHLTISWDQTANNSCAGGCEDIVLYAAALSEGSGNATGASASFSSGQSVQMSGTVPISNIPLAAFDPQPPGAPPIVIQNAQLGHTQLGHTQLGHTQLGHTQLGQTQLGHTQLGQTQLGHTQLGHTQLGQTQLGHTQLGHTQLDLAQLGHTQLGHTQLAQTGLTLDQVPLDPTEHPDGWPGLLAGTTLAGQPLQTITLDDVYSLTSPPNPQAAITAIQNLTFADVDLQDSTLGNITMDALTLGDSLINQLGGELQTDIETQLNAWCMSIVASGDPPDFCTGSDPGIGYFSLIQLALIGAPVDSLQLGHTQLGQTQLGHTQLGHTPVGHIAGSASGIAGMQLDKLDLTPGLGIADLQIAGLPTSLFDCSNPANFDCTNGALTLGEAQLAGAIKPTTLVGDLDVGDFFVNVTIGQLLDSVRGPLSAYKDYVTFGDVVGLLLQSNDVDWESLQPDLLTIFDPNRNQLSMSAGFTVQGTGTPSADVTIDLPVGFDFVPGSATLQEAGQDATPLEDPTITDGAAGSGYELAWHLGAVDAGADYTLSFDAFPGTTVGPTEATETVSAGGHSSSSIATFSVTDSFPNDGSAPNATPIDTTPAHDTVELSTLPTAGAVDYYSIPMPPAGTRVSFHLTDLPADYDLALYSPRSTSVRTGTAATPAPPLQDGIVPDQQVNLDGGSSGQLTPSGLEDVPDPGIPLIQLSDNRHEDDEDVGMVSPGGGGVITVAVFGYNGAFSPQAYTLRVRETPPQAPEVCTARSFPDAGQGTTPTPLPLLSALPANLNTIILVDEKRLGDTYGATDEANAVAKLTHLAGDGSLGVSGIVVPVESIAGVQSLYDTWDSNPCDPNAANAVANAIADEVDAIAAARPSVRYVVFGGGDDQIPFFRLPDLSLIANEDGFAGQFHDNEYEGSLAAGDLLSDDPYLDTNPVPASGQQLFPPNLSGGRLVETAQDIANAVTAFENAPTPGALKSSTGYVSGYDFVADGSQRVAANLRSNGVSVQTLIDDPLNPLPTPWGSASLLAGAFPGAGPANVNSWNGHYDNYRAQMDNGEIISTSDLPTGLNNGIFFTMGCHAGFQTTDAVVGSSVLDWPQYFSEHNTGFVGNTGFGLGETDSVAFSEELMADFAGQLTGSQTLGQALEQAKQQYYLSRVAFSNYDTKALSEAELYGLPMYGVGHAPTSLPPAGHTATDPVNGTSQSTSPSTGSLSPFSSGVQSASFSASPSFTEQDRTDGDFFTSGGQVQAPNYRPLQPYVSLPAARSGLVAHGVVIDGLTSMDHTTDSHGNPWRPDNVRPILNSGAAELPPTFTDEAWPEKIPTLVSLGTNQSLNLITGQYFTEGDTSTTGVERLWTQIGGRVTYSTSSDFTPPTIDSSDAYVSGGFLAFSGHFSDLDQNGQPGHVVFAQVVYDDGAGHWTALPLQFNSNSGMWTGAVPFGGTTVQYFVEACDAAGNCGYSSNKGRYFDAQPIPSGSSSGGGLTLTPSGPQAASGPWYTGPVSVSATTDSGPAAISADGSQPSGGPVSLTGDGTHVVHATDSAGNTADGVYLIDSTGPTVTHTISPAAPNGANGWYTSKPTVSFSCTDNLSGVKSCGATTVLGEGVSQGATGTGVDNAGNVSHDSVSGIKVDVTPPSLPTFNGITNGATYKPSALPAQSAITCSSHDALSGLAGCAVTGYSAALGTHTLTATATDNAGNTSTATATYTVAKVDPTITWNPPASILFGTPLSSSQLNATANVAGTFVYSPAAGTLLQPGSRTLSATFTPTNTTDYNKVTVNRTITVGFSQACQTGTISGSLTIKSGTAYCIQGGKVSGSITVLSGAALYVSGGTLSGSVTATGSTAFTVCGSTVSGSISVSSSSGLVQLGGPTGSGCAANTLSASVSLSGNNGGVNLVGNTIGGSVTASSNKGGVLFSGNKAASSVTVNGNSGGVTFTSNVVKGSVTISNNTGGFAFSGNTISGVVTLKNNS